MLLSAILPRSLTKCNPCPRRWQSALSEPLADRRECWLVVTCRVGGVVPFEASWVANLEWGLLSRWCFQQIPRENQGMKPDGASTSREVARTALTSWTRAQGPGHLPEGFGAASGGRERHWT